MLHELDNFVCQLTTIIITIITTTFFPWLIRDIRQGAAEPAREPALALRDGVHLEEGVHLVEIDVLVDAVATHLPRASWHRSQPSLGLRSTTKFFLEGRAFFSPLCMAVER